MYRSVYGNVTVIVVVIVSVCVVCNLSAMMSHLFWSLEHLLTGDNRKMVSGWRRQVGTHVTLRPMLIVLVAFCPPV